MERQWQIGDVVLVKEWDIYSSKHRIVRKTPKMGVLDDERRFWLENGRLVKQFSLSVVLATGDLLALYEKQEQLRAEKEQEVNRRYLLQRKAYKAINHMQIGHFVCCSDEQLEKVVAVFEEAFPQLYSHEEGK